MSFKNIKRSAYTDKDGLRGNCDNTTIKDRKPDLKLMPNHYRFKPTVHYIKTN